METADSPSMPPPGKIPLYPISEHVSGASPEVPFVPGRFEESTRRGPKRLRLHPHDFHEVFWLNGRGRFFCDFREYAIESPTPIFVSPGQVHSWTPGPALAGPMTCFSQALYAVSKHFQRLLQALPEFTVGSIEVNLRNKLNL